jgi:hypothetical protein
LFFSLALIAMMGADPRADNRILGCAHQNAAKGVAWRRFLLG